MSTSNPLDTALLEQLANQYFQAQPGQQPAASHNDILLQHGETVNMAEPQTSLHDPHFPGGRGLIPASVAGSGKSPSAQQLGEDPKIGGPGNQVDTSTLTSTGGGRTPASLPLENEHTFEAQLQQALKGITQYAPTGQLPFTGHSSDQLPFSGIPGSQPPLPGFPAAQLPFSGIPGSQPPLPGFPATQSPFSGASQLPFAGSSYYFMPSDAPSAVGSAPFDVNKVKADFPILNQYVNGRPLIWLDNAATTQKPRHVIERLSYFYGHENSNIHRGAHTLAARATDAYEEARKKVQLFLNAKSPNEIVFVRGTTEAINLVANSWGDQNIKAGDEIVVTHLEHHANIVPWQQLAARKGAVLKVAPVDDDGQIILEEYARLLGPKTKLVSFTQVSNALGTVTPAKQMTDLAHQAGAKVLIDGAQSVSHMKADVQYLNADWFAFSGHKVFGPTGIGVLYGKEDLLNETQPWQGGGNMISDVTFEHTKYQPAPARFEAGTGNIADAVGLGAAIDYVNSIGIELIHQYEHYLLQYATRLLKDIPGLRLIGTAPDKAGVLSFVLQGFRTEEVGTALSNNGIAVRSGHHCAQPILRRFGLESSVRPSLAFYNTCADIDALVATVHRLRSASPL
ncbi:family 2A encapsulin nanocompartment cargo protein cysteine desulfurase [Chitinophaga silvisoli]|uniref:cysteine desulfurase n=1 Tax=Chitinophaga silvisoli TaxID=2291814 RepID=A0A3E1NYN4_9BACT|nr:family 2A encapsulin nanocompartment cargo protein cysteine desulfurase [Chitinophaga silvisoli]RFM33005.1 SufS family cysteine desulfurase [Chitinophaga silvisoli]